VTVFDQAPTRAQPAWRDTLRRAAALFGPPIAAFLLARVSLVLVAASVGERATKAKAWSRWDSAHYLSIAERGYEFFSCARLPGYDPTHHCGNTGWLPGLPWLIRAATALHVAPVRAGVWIAGACALVTLVVLWVGFLGPRLSSRGLLTLGLAAFFPGFVYEHALFPVSLCALCQVSAIKAFEQRRFVLAGVAGACGAFSYSSGIFFAAVLGLPLLLTTRPSNLRRRVPEMFAAAGITALGFAAFLAVLQLEVGNWRAYFLVQQKYGFGINAPWKTLLPHLESLSKVPSQQTIFVAVLALALLWAAARAPRILLDGVLATFLLFYWLVPLMLGGQLSLYRAEAVLLPAVLLARKLPTPVLAALTAVAVLIGLRMGALFFRGILV